MLDHLRIDARLDLSEKMDIGACLAAVSAYEPHVPWQYQVLARRAACYTEGRHPGAEIARNEFAEFLEAQPTPIELRLQPPQSTAEQTP